MGLFRFEDLDNLVRRPVKECITDVPVTEVEQTTAPQVILSDCESAVRTAGPEGVIIQKCCLTETQFQNCLRDCYLKYGQTYQTCLSNCLRGAGDEISICNHSLNFYCCGM